MLLELTIGNFRSIRDDVSLSLLASSLKAGDPSLNENNVFKTTGGPKTLRTAVIYGANASGKSNLVQAIAHALWMILHSAGDSQQGAELPMQPFLLDAESSDEPTFIEFVVHHEGTQYRYGFEATSERIHREWLSYIPPGKRKERELFQRESDDYKIAPGFAEGEKFKEVTRPNALLLSACAKWAGPVSSEVITAISQVRIGTGLNDAGMMEFTVGMAEDQEKRTIIRKFLRHFDLGFDDFSVERKSIKRDDLPTSLPDEVVNVLLMDHYNVSTIHQIYDDSENPIGQRTLDLARHESAGTQRLFALAAPIITTLLTGSTLIIDEFDARIHANISRRLIEIFQSPTLNPKGAQLIALTHDTNLLSKDLLRRDQIWFLEKDAREQSILYSLAEFRKRDGKPERNDASYEPRYIKGRYGAVPKILDSSELAQALFPDEDT